MLDAARQPSEEEEQRDKGYRRQQNEGSCVGRREGADDEVGWGVRYITSSAATASFRSKLSSLYHLDLDIRSLPGSDSHDQQKPSPLSLRRQSHGLDGEREKKKK